MVASAAREFAIADLLTPFAQLSKDSREYQGHGWGCSYRRDDSWQHYHCIKPIWEDDLTQFRGTTHLLVHARSAFRDEGIVVENNMPFTDGDSVFIFNGELRGVRIKSEGRIGAEKIYNYVRRLNKGDLQTALSKAVDIISRRSQYVRAMNIIMSDASRILISCNYSEDPGYFQMQQATLNDIEIVCSEAFADTGSWHPLVNHSTIALRIPHVSD